MILVALRYQLSIAALTNCPETYWPNATLISSQFQRDRNPDTAEQRALLQALSQAVIKVSAESIVISQLHLKRISFPTHSGGNWQVQFLVGFWTEGLSFRLSRGHPVTCHVHPSIMAIVSLKPTSLKGKTEDASKREVTISYKLILKVTSHSFCCILSVQAGCLVQPTFDGGDCTG